jgi:hypothetical protein
MVLAFDSLGRFLGRIGEKGRDVGQFMLPVWVAPGPGDSLRIFDFITAGETVFDPDWRPIRRRLGESPTLVWRPDGKRVITVVASQDSAASANTVHVVGDDGRPIVSMNPVLLGDTTPGRRTPRVAAASDGGTWTMEMLGYTARKWSTEGVLEFEIRRTPSWLSRPMPISDGLLGAAPSPRVWDIREDSHNRLWVLTGLAANEWKTGLGDPVSSGGRTYYERVNNAVLFDSVVDVFDARSGDLIVSGKFRGNARFLLDENAVAVYRESASGDRSIEIWRVLINGRW